MEYLTDCYIIVCGSGFSANPYSSQREVCTLAKAKTRASSWEVSGHEIDYCMVEKVEEKCQLRFSLAIMLIVIFANIIKATVMFITIWKFQTPTLVTIGDAIASFLDNPDETTAGMCLSTKKDFNGKGNWDNTFPREWIIRSSFWFNAASVKRWFTCNILWVSNYIHIF